MINIRSLAEIEIIRQNALMVSQVLGLVAEEIEEGMTTGRLDEIAEEFIRDHGGSPSFKGYNGFPNALCISINEEVVHGIPSPSRYIKDGDIVSVDCGVFKDGFHGDHAYTFMIGNVKPEIRQLVKVTLECLYLGIEQMQTGRRLGDLGFAIQQHAHKYGYGIPRQLTGHGLGEELHEEPIVANHGKRGSGIKFQNGIVLAVEPMINMGTKEVLQLDDNWTIISADRKPSCHFEHDVAIINNKPVILSTFKYVEAALAKKGLEVLV